MESNNLNLNTKIALDKAMNDMLSYQFDKQFIERMTISGHTKAWMTQKPTDLEMVWNSVLWDHKDYDLGI